MLIVNKETGEYCMDYEGAKEVLDNALKPCPFCGNEMVFLLHSPNTNHPEIDDCTTGTIYCHKCGIEIVGAGKKPISAQKLKSIWQNRVSIKAKVKIELPEYECPDGYKTIRWGQCTACGEKNGWARPIPGSYSHCPDCGALLDWSSDDEVQQQEDND